MMLVDLLHHDIEWADEQLAAGLEARGFTVRRHDVREVDFAELSSCLVVLNRVYASVSSRDLPAVWKAMELVERLAAHGIRCVNGPRGTRADYDKFFAYQCMADAGVATPSSRKIEPADPPRVGEIIKRFAAEHGYPVILKPNTGGRGRDVTRIAEPGEVDRAVRSTLRSGRSIGYTGAWLVQAFVSSSRSCDCRISIINGRFTHSHTRTLVAHGGETPWIASHALGSKFERYQPTAREIEVAMAATEAIGADCNQVDMAFGRNGPVIIENNPTPQFSRQVSEYAIPLLVDGMAAIVASVLSPEPAPPWPEPSQRLQS